jgi:hypothetical protein
LEIDVALPRRRGRDIDAVGRRVALVPVRHVPLLKCSEWSTIVVHLTLNSSSTRRGAQSSSSMTGLNFGTAMVPRW